MKKLPIVEIPEGDAMYERSFYNGVAYRTHDLHILAEGGQKFDMPLVGINININPWVTSLDNLSDFIFHSKRVEDANLKFPIILSPEGSILDGFHRICKAIMEDKTTIKAVRLIYMPESIKEQCEEDSEE